MSKLKKMRAIELLSAGEMKNKAVAEAVGISENSLYKWLKDPVFSNSVIARARELLKAKLPELLKVAEEKSIDGSHQHLKILMDHMDRLEERAAMAQQSSMTFTWNTTLPAEKEEEE